MGVLGVERGGGGSVRSLEKALIPRVRYVGADLCVRPIARARTRKNGRTHRADTQVRPYENRTPRHSGESRNPFSPLSLAFRPAALSPDRRRYGHRHIYPPHPFRIRARRSLPRAGIKCENESKNHKMDSGFRRNDGGFPASRGFFNRPPQGGSEIQRALSRDKGTPPCQGGKKKQKPLYRWRVLPFYTPLLRGGRGGWF